ncbi:MAG: fused response regulator/phosphatase [Ectothiorhodospiraceae bacterium]|nr:fused response regulator/phosphatase [Ectothiorhodospiraceae bacterium]
MPAHILVVDDEPDLELLVRQKFRKHIRNEEFNFFFAHNGEEALDVLEQHKEIEILMTDINMPKMDGLSLLSGIKERDVNPLLKSIIVSAYGDMANIRQAMNRGAFDFITKPIDFSDVEITLQKTIGLLDTLKSAKRSEKELTQLYQQLHAAKQIQQSILPQDFPPYPERKEFDVFAHMIAAKEVGGDFYDFFLIDENRFGFVIADVSDKGIPAAIFMAVSRTVLKGTATQGISPSECLERVNTILNNESDSGMFLTAFYGILDVKSGKIDYANGGHNPPYLVRNGSGVIPVASNSDPLIGIIDNAKYEQFSLDLKEGDTLFLFTDGITEALNKTEEMYSEDRLIETLRKQTGSAPEVLIPSIISEIADFAQGAPQSDDITCLAIRYNGAST